ncbi:MAG: hypothetical protein ACPGRH_02155 [Alphaproteobacteria bacterium]
MRNTKSFIFAAVALAATSSLAFAHHEAEIALSSGQVFGVVAALGLLALSLIAAPRIAKRLR